MSSRYLDTKDAESKRNPSGFSKRKEYRACLGLLSPEVWKHGRSCEECALTKPNQIQKPFLGWKIAKAMWTEGNESKLEEELLRFS